MILKKYIGDKKFYKSILIVILPIMVQTAITNFVSLLDNIMVGSLGTEAMSGVSIVNQFIFIFNLVVFGADAAAGIFTSQYHGLNDTEGEKHTFRFKLIISVVATLLAIGVFFFFGDNLINSFLHEQTEKKFDLALALLRGKEYLKIMLIGLIPYAVSQVYASTMRETGTNAMPMIASAVAVGTNTVFNFILIFGFFGVPALGVKGAAIATVIARFVELLILIIWGHTHKKNCRFLVGAYKSLRIPINLTKQITIKGLPLMANEVCWALAVTLRNQCYSTRGLDSVAAQNISSTLSNLFSVVYMSIGSSIAIIVGNLLGAGKLDEARDTDRKIMAFSVGASTVMGLLMIGTSAVFPLIYDTTESVRNLSTYMIIVFAVTMPFCAFAHSAYFTFRSGGRVFITLLFDSVYMWALVIPLTASLAYFSPLNIYILFAICQGADIIKAVFGYVLLKKGNWVHQIV